MVIFGGMNKAMTLEMSVQTFELDNTIVDTRVKNQRKEEERKRALEAQAERSRRGGTSSYMKQSTFIKNSYMSANNESISSKNSMRRMQTDLPQVIKDQG